MNRIFPRLAMTIAFLCLLLTAFLPVTASAHVERPARPAGVLTANCSANASCYGRVAWGNGNLYPIAGAQTNLTISNPNLSTSNGNWERKLAIYRYVDAAEIETGIEKVGAGNNFVNCSGSNTLWFYIHTVTSSGVNHTFCRVVPSGDINAQATFRISRNADGSYEVIVNFKNHDSPCEGGGCSEYNISAPVYHYIKIEETIQDTFSNQHKVWGSAWGYNMYQDPSTRNFYYQPQANCNGQGSGGCPGGPGPQPIMYWHIWPQNSSTGGELYSCDYDPDPSGACTYGSYKMPHPHLYP
jgi:hypothetical protein